MVEHLLCKQDVIGSSPITSTKNNNMRKCKKCGEKKMLSEFPINNTLASGILRKHTCNTCRNIQAKDRRRLHKKHKKPKSAICPICEVETSDLKLDHDHKTGEFRGWLCNDCNNALGKFNDSAKFLKRAIKYLNV